MTDGPNLPMMFLLFTALSCVTLDPRYKPMFWGQPVAVKQDKVGKSSPVISCKLSKQGIQMLERFEGFRSNVYIAPNGKRTIGYGHELRGHDVIHNMTRMQAEAYVHQDLKGARDFLDKQQLPWMTQNKCDALLLLIYNIGLSKFTKSPIWTYLKQGKFDQATNHWLRYTYAHDPITGKQMSLDGLVKRRQAEVDLFGAK